MIDENFVPDDEDDPEDDKPEGRAPCPVCRSDFFEDGPCEHLVSSWTFREEDSFWESDDSDPGAASPKDFGSAVSDLIDALDESDKEFQKHVLNNMVPSHLVTLVSESLARSRLDSAAADRYLESLIEASPTYAGCCWCETDSMCSSAWMNYYDHEAFASVQAVEKRLGEDVKVLRAVIDKLAEQEMPPE